MAAVPGISAALQNGPKRDLNVDASFLTGANAVFIGELYAAYLKNSGAVDPSWATFFQEMGDDAHDLLAELEGASWAPSDATIIGAASDAPPAKAEGKGKPAAAGAESAAILKQA